MLAPLSRLIYVKRGHITKSATRFLATIVGVSDLAQIVFSLRLMRNRESFVEFLSRVPLHLQS